MAAVAVGTVGLVASMDDDNDADAAAGAGSPTPAPTSDPNESPSTDAAGASESPTDEGPGDAVDTPTPSPAAPTSPAEEATDGGASSGPSAATSFDEGQALVGQDVVPGLYAALVPESSEGCWWERLENLDARYSDSVAAGEAAAGARVVVEVMDTDEAFRSTGCGPWEPYVPADQPATTIGEGTWLVGTDISPGRYRSTGPASAGGECSWERRLGFSDSFYDIVQSATATDPVVLQIEPSDTAFTSRGCGEWEPVE